MWSRHVKGLVSAEGVTWILDVRLTYWRCLGKLSHGINGDMEIILNWGYEETDCDDMNRLKCCVYFMLRLNFF